MPEDQNILFDVETQIGFRVRTTKEYWKRSITKHPEIAQKQFELMEVLNNPTEIRISNQDENVYLFYGKEGKYWLTAVVKKINSIDFFLTSYLTDKIKEGKTIWHK